MVMKPEVAKQAFEDPKVFMAKVLVLAQETLEKYAPLPAILDLGVSLWRDS